MDSRNPRQRLDRKNNGSEVNLSCRLNQLPDEILHHIFSFLHVEEAIKCSSLSRRWTRFWVSLPILNFDFFESGDIREYENKWITLFVQKVLLLHDKSKFKRFRFTCHEISNKYIYNWILFAVRNNVEELHFEISIDGRYVFPSELFSCSSLSELTLISRGPFGALTSAAALSNMDVSPYVEFKIPDTICLPNLKMLRLGSFRFEGERNVTKFLSRLPRLETLIISDGFFHQAHIVIASDYLKHLEIENSIKVDDKFGLVNGSVKIHAPNLVFFRCGDFVNKKYLLENVSSLVSADIKMVKEREQDGDEEPSMPREEKKKVYAQCMLKFLGALHNVTELTLSAPFIEVVTGPALLEKNPTKFCNLRRLKLVTGLTKDDINAIRCFFKISPNIETLIVTTKLLTRSQLYPQCDVVKFNSGNISDYWEPGLCLECPMNHLKVVKLWGLYGCVNEMKFLEILLKNSLALEKLVIRFTYMDYIQEKVVERRMDFMEKLQMFPKASSRTKFMVNLRFGGQKLNPEEQH